MYYRFIPVWKDNSRGNWATFVGDDSIVHSRFDTIEAGLKAAKNDGTALREMNWEIRKCHWGLFWRRVYLCELYANGYLSDTITRDNISPIYHFK